MQSIHRFGGIGAGIATALATSAILVLSSQRTVQEKDQVAEEEDGPITVSDVTRGDPSPGVWDIPIHRTAQVERWIDFYSTGRGRRYFEDWLDRMTRYEGPIREGLERRGMPEDLVYIALIESGFEPLAVSQARASGLWQIMPATARDHGLRINSWVDERLDPIRSTTAAIDFLDSLHDRFGSWYLAVAAYNTGASRVHRVLEAHVGEGPWTEEHFWKISPYLPSETRQHVPRLIAAAILGKEPRRFGFRPEASEPRSYETVFALGETPLARVAAAAGVSEEEVRALNPHLIRGSSPPETFYPIRVPEGTAGEVVLALGNDRSPRVSEQTFLAE